MTSPTVRSGLVRVVLAACCASAALAAPPLGGVAARAQEAASAVQDVALDNLVIDLGDATVTAATLIASGTRLSKDELLAILKDDGKQSWAARLARLDAASLAAPELRVERKIGEVRQIAVYKDLVVKGVHGGRAAELNAAGATLSVEGGQGGTGSYGKMQAADVDLAGLARLYGEPGDGKGPLQRVYASFSIENIAFGDDDATVKLAKLGGADFAGRQIPATWSGATKAFGALDLDNADAAEKARVSGIAADLMEAVSVGSLEASGLSIKTLKDEAAEIGIGRMAYAAAGADAGMVLSDFHFSGAGTQARLGSIKLSGFSLEPTIATLRRLAKNAETSDSELRRLTPVIGTVAISALSIELPQDAEAATPPAEAPADPLLKDAPKAAGADPIRLGLRDATLTFGPPKNGVPAASRMAFSGLTMPSALVAGVPGLGSLSLYGYRDLDLGFVADAAWNEAAQELSLREVSISGKEMGRIRLNGILGGIVPEVFDPDSAVSSLAMLSATAKALDLTVENGGLFERFIDATAKSLSLKPDELRKEYVTASVIGVPVILGNSPAAKSIGAAMGKFVTKPGTLLISAKAKNGTGVGIADFSTAASPAAVLDKLDVNAKSE